MEKIGTVISIEGNKAVVRVRRASSCGENCANCAGGCADTRRFVTAVGAEGVNVGDMVKLTLSDHKILLAAFAAYLLPFLTLLAGYAVFQAAGAAVGFVLPFIALKVLDKKSAKRYTATITKIWERCQ
ncbi:MAG: SoxR reducing system RseC family protein [Clostridiales bacterium]|jgi:sigma-E factor negative regulatory protein RseC|nr:SoxR reducing system RseC family protein [Clostridiales bacterium]